MNREFPFETRRGPAHGSRIIALVGHAGSGKDTVAQMIADARDNVARIAFAEPLKRFCAEVFGFTDAQLYGPSEERNRPDPRWTRPDGEPLTARFALQTLGTEWGRNCDPDIWAKAGVNRALAAIAAGAERAVITDCRFVNEARIVREAGGQVWRITRPGAGLKGAAATHPSELEQVSPEMDALVTLGIRNTGTLRDLRETVETLLRFN